MKPDYFDCDMEVKEVSDTGTFTAYLSTFGGAPDDGGDIIKRGAFLQSLSEGGRNGNGVMMLRGHNPERIPGVWTSLVENNRGLKGEGELILDTELGKETYTLLKKGALKGVSIGFTLPKAKGAKRAWEFDPESFSIDEKTQVRTLKRIILMEASLVAFPMNRRATVTSVKSFQEATTPREYEEALRDAGLSRSFAKHVVSMIRPNLRDADGQDQTAMQEAILKAIRDEKTRFNLSGIL